MPANPGKPAGEQPPATRLETDEEVRQVLQARRARLAAASPKRSASQAPPAPRPALEPRTERPMGRPPVAMLCILDDGKQDGEWVRLRADRTVIGRTDGEVRIPHDPLISGRHAEIVRRPATNGFRWFLTDLQSTNGTFVRIGSSPLWDECEFLVGTGRYRFEAAAPAAEVATAPPRTPEQSTRAWSDDSMRALVPSLVELTSAGVGRRLALTLPEYWVGRDPSCVICRAEDLYVNARHARLYRDARSHWHIENHKSLNGLWLRLIEPMPLPQACRFRLGEQRFIFRVT